MTTPVHTHLVFALFILRCSTSKHRDFKGYCQSSVGGQRVA